VIEAPALPPPDGRATVRIIDGVREAWMYDVNRAEVLVRHDAIVRGEQMTVAGEPIQGGDLESELRRRRIAALVVFNAQDEKT
jgi:hypothetical protein